MQLHQLEVHGIVRKKVYPNMPPRVEYSLTQLGETLLPIVQLMGNWGKENRKELQKVVREQSAPEEFPYKSIPLEHRLLQE